MSGVKHASSEKDETTAPNVVAIIELLSIAWRLFCVIRPALVRNQVYYKVRRNVCDAERKKIIRCAK